MFQEKYENQCQNHVNKVTFCRHKCYFVNVNSASTSQCHKALKHRALRSRENASHALGRQDNEAKTSRSFALSNKRSKLLCKRRVLSYDQGQS